MTHEEISKAVDIEMWRATCKLPYNWKDEDNTRENWICYALEYLLRPDNTDKDIIKAIGLLYNLLIYKGEG